MHYSFRIDWELLRQQKEWLLQHSCEEADGLLELLDVIQDQAVATKQASEEEVFAEIDN